MRTYRVIQSIVTLHDTLAAQSALTAFREREQLVDPSHATLAVLETIARLSTDAAELSVQLNEMMKGSPHSPARTALRSARAARHKCR